MLFTSEGKTCFCTRENNFPSDAGKANWGEWEARKWRVSKTAWNWRDERKGLQPLQELGVGWGRGGGGKAWQAYILLHLFFLEPHLPPPPPLEKSFYRDGSSAGLLLAYCRFSLVSCPILIKVQKCSFGQLPIPWHGPSGGGGWQFNLNQSVSLLNFLYFCNSMTHTSLESWDAVWVAFVSFISLVIIWGKSWNL